jgi:hypothetical protein
MIVYIPSPGDVLELDGRRITVERIDEAARRVHFVLSFAERKGGGRYWKDKREFVNEIVTGQFKLVRQEVK